EAHPGLVDVEASDDRGGAALQDSNNPAFRAVVARPLDARHHAVAVHGLIEVVAGNENVAADAVDRPIGDDEPETTRVRLDAADHQVHAVRQTEAVAAR